MCLAEFGPKYDPMGTEPQRWCALRCGGHGSRVRMSLGVGFFHGCWGVSVCACACGVSVLVWRVLRLLGQPHLRWVRSAWDSKIINDSPMLLGAFKKNIYTWKFKLTLFRIYSYIIMKRTPTFYLAKQNQYLLWFTKGLVKRHKDWFSQK